ncbi:Gfo/Idh/MocA family protein [Paenibacillus hodogayensis]|uniref:Gfo/Idh/MocA family protein n=1 Tax=Paenibacillus hodogayensis TaxID=279208 RepID=A0ABV5W6Z6_9BACL
MSYQFSIIGCRHGHISNFIQWMLDNGHTCTGIYDPEDWKLARLYAEKYGIPLVDEREKLLSPDVQIVGSSAVNNEKIELIEACERRGIHIMLDKPAVTDRSGLKRLEAVVARGNIQIGLMLPKRFSGWMNALKSQIDAGAIGKLAHIHISSPHKLMPSTRDAWHFSKERNGGVLIDLLIHDMDLLRWLTGREIILIQSVLAKNMLPEYPDFYDVASVQVVMDNGTTAQLYADWHTPGNNTDGRFSRIVVAGTEGYAEWDVGYDASDGKKKRQLRITRGEAQDQNGYVDAQAEVVVSASSDFIDRINGKPGLFTHRDILEASRAAIEADERAVRRTCYE